LICKLPFYRPYESLLLDVILQIIKRKLITIFEFPIIRLVFLKSVVCQMNVPFINRTFIKCEFLSCGSYIPLSAKKGFLLLVDHHPDSNIKFPLSNQKRLFYILLDHKVRCFDLILRIIVLLFFTIRILNKFLYCSFRNLFHEDPTFFKTVKHMNPSSSVA